MAQLKFVNNLSQQTTSKRPTPTTIHIGRRYQMGGQDFSLLNSSHGVAGDYRITSKNAQLSSTTSVTANGEMNVCYFWDTDIDLSQLGNLVHDSKDQALSLKDCKLASNRLAVNAAELIGPELRASDQNTTLMLSPQFDLTFCTDSYAAQLGAIHLVQSCRFITLENNRQIRLLDTSDNSESEAPVLYLEHQRDDQPVKLISPKQEKDRVGQYTFRCEISQQIPDEVNGDSVASVTVLEQYASYFMQRALSADDQHTIWTPVYVPLLWGWSIRVGRRTDGEWGILRRKLILPTGGNDGLQLPVWKTNTVECSPLEKILV